VEKGSLEQRFIDALAKIKEQARSWCRELLVRAGLAEDDGQATGIAPGAPFQIRATPFFKAWSRLGKTS
jgi:prolyl-tRNA synthetase